MNKINRGIGKIVEDYVPQVIKCKCFGCKKEVAEFIVFEGLSWCIVCFGKLTLWKKGLLRILNRCSDKTLF